VFDAALLGRRKKLCQLFYSWYPSSSRHSTSRPKPLPLHTSRRWSGQVWRRAQMEGGVWEISHRS